MTCEEETMPRKQRGFAEPPRRIVDGLVERLVDELKANRQSGQPVIDEEEFPTKKLRVNVIWDAWERLPLEDRTATILRAYEKAEGREFRDRIALASGLTVPEAHAAGWLPYQVIAAVRKSDPVTLDECRQALIDEGASVLFGEDNPQLRFATAEEAEAAIKRLATRLPNSEPVWVVTREAGTVEDWTER
jgi:hypothetical protein